MNTDGIHLERSSGINVTDSVIGTGNDCVSVGPGSPNGGDIFCDAGYLSRGSHPSNHVTSPMVTFKS